MNLYLRLLLIIIKIKRLRLCIEPEGTSRISFRVWPHDCDLNLHLTNSRYLAFMDLARKWMPAENATSCFREYHSWRKSTHLLSIELRRGKQVTPAEKRKRSNQIFGFENSEITKIHF